MSTTTRTPQDILADARAVQAFGHQEFITEIATVIGLAESLIEAEERLKEANRQLGITRNLLNHEQLVAAERGEKLREIARIVL